MNVTVLVAWGVVLQQKNRRKARSGSFVHKGEEKVYCNQDSSKSMAPLDGIPANVGRMPDEYQTIILRFPTAAPR